MKKNQPAAAGRDPESPTAMPGRGTHRHPVRPPPPQACPPASISHSPPPEHPSLTPSRQRDMQGPGKKQAGRFQAGKKRGGANGCGTTHLGHITSRPAKSLLCRTDARERTVAALERGMCWPTGFPLLSSVQGDVPARTSPELHRQRHQAVMSSSECRVKASGAVESPKVV